MGTATNIHAWTREVVQFPQSNPQPRLQTWIRFLPARAQALSPCETSHGDGGLMYDPHEAIPPRCQLIAGLSLAELGSRRMGTAPTQPTTL
jgi:hypothetical protein